MKNNSTPPDIVRCPFGDMLYKKGKKIIQKIGVTTLYVMSYTINKIKGLIRKMCSIPFVKARIIPLSCLSLALIISLIVVNSFKTDIKKVNETTEKIESKQTTSDNQSEVADLSIEQAIIDSSSDNVSQNSDVQSTPASTNKEEIAEEITYTGANMQNKNIYDIAYKYGISSASLDKMLPVATVIWNTMMSYGYNSYVCAGILGNIQQECTFNYTSGGCGYGICQWTGSRKSNLFNYYGTDLNSQIRFLHDELASYQGILNCNSPDSAAEYFCYNFERPGIPKISKRISYANMWYEIFA